MNKGLNKKTTQYTTGIGDISVLSNLYKYDGNVHIVMPLMTTFGSRGLDISLIYNSQDKNEISEFGYGVKLNLYNELKNISVDYINVKSSDGQIYRYDRIRDIEEIKYYNDETKITIEESAEYDEEESETTCYELCDKLGNKNVYDQYNLKYPKAIFLKSLNSKFLYFDSNGAIEQYSNLDNDDLLFEKNSDGLISTIKWMKGTQLIEEIGLEYSSLRLVGITVKRDSAVIKNYIIAYISTGIIITDNISKENIKLTISENRLTNIVRGVENTYKSVSTSIAYNINRTVVTNELGLKHVYVFNNSNLLYEMDHYGNVKVNYYLTGKELKDSESIIHKDDIRSDKNIINDLSIANFTASKGFTYNEIQITDEYYSGILGDTVEHVFGNQIEFTYTKSMPLKLNEEVVLIMWVKQETSYNGSNYATISLNTDNDSVSKVFNKTTTDSEYQPIILGIRPSKNYNSLTIKLEYEGIVDLYISKMALIKMDSGIRYEYDSEGNLTKVKNKRAENNYRYNSMNMVDDSLVEGRRCKCEYDGKNNLISAEGAYGVKEKIEYDSKNRVTKKTLCNREESRKFETANFYNSDYEVVNSGELLNHIREERDYFGNLLNQEAEIELANTDNAIIDILRLSYENSYLLSKQELERGSDKVEVNYTYNNGLIKTVRLSDIEYTYTYENNKLTKIDNNGVILIQYEYDDYDRVSKVIKSNGCQVLISYNQNGEIEKIEDESGEYEYEYDYRGLLSQVKKNNIVIREYEYDNDRRLIKDGIDNNYISYSYNDDGLLQINRNVENKSLIERYNSPNKIKGYYPELIEYKYYNEFLTCMFLNGVYHLRGAGYQYNLLNTENPIIVTDGITCVDKNTSPLTYSLPIEHRRKGSYGLWVKPKEESNIFNSRLIYLYSFSNLSDDYSHIYIKTNSEGKVEVYIRALNCDYDNKILTANKLQNDWTFIGLSWENVNGYSKITLVLDGMEYYSELNYNLYFENDVNLELCGNIESYVTGIMCSHNNVLSVEKLKEYYKVTREYLISKDDISLGTDLVSSVAFKNNQDIEIFPLENSLNSVNGIKPYLSERDNPEDYMFTYNRKLKRFMYNPDGRKVEYDLNIENEISIGMNVYIELYGNNQTILELSEAYSTLRLFINYSGNIYLEYDGFQINTGFSVNTKELTFVGISLKKVDTDEDGLNIYDIKVYKNDLVFTHNFCANFENYHCDLTLGRKNSNINIEPLCGQIERMLVKLAFDINFTSVKENIGYVNTITGYDEFGLEKTKTIYNSNEKEIYRKTNYYKSRTSDTGNAGDAAFTSNYINREEYKMKKIEGNILKDITFSVNYKYDSIGRVKRIINTDSGFYSHTYAYNYRGYLLSDNDEIYEYDGNGNITRLGSKSFEYQNGYKDKLTKACGYDVIYDNSNPLYPKSWNGRSYTWNNGRLITYQYNGETVEFTYNEKGLRSSKKKNNITTYYYYHNDRLITEINNNYRIDYIYDQSNIIVGFIYNDSTYYYVRDCLQNIIGIIDSNGSLIVKYNYNAYGNNMTITGNTNIGNINPFRYKGYYYDVETGLFMVGHRYYNPEWGRWIQPDDIEYLDPTNINGLNLYAYCNNDPVNMYDPDGHFSLPNWAKWVIGGVAFAGAVALTIVSGGSLAPVFIGMGVSIASSALIEGAISYANGEGFWNGVADGAADGAMWGGIFALAGATIGAIKYGLSAKGAVKGTQHFTTITKGQQFDRYGRLTGKYITDIGTSASKLALPATNTGIKTSLQATRNFRVITGVVADAFGGTGGGTQYVMRYSIEKLLNMGWLVII